MKTKLIYTCLGIAVILVGWGMTWANQNANRSDIETLDKKMGDVSEQVTDQLLS